MRPRDLARILQYTIQANMSTLIVGGPGIGKSDLVRQAAAAAKYDLIVTHPAISDPTDYKGLPAIIETGNGTKKSKKATFLPFDDLELIYNAKGPTVVFLDDLGQAAPATQAATMQLIHSATNDRRINGRQVPPHVTFISATNRRGDRAAVSGILEPVKTRQAGIYELEPSLDDWINDFALPNNLPPELIAFLRSFKPELFYKFDPTSDIVNQPTPRTWSIGAAKVLEQNVPADLELLMLGGAVGEGAAAELSGYLRIYRDLPDLDDILMDPDHAMIPRPDQPSVLHALSTGLAAKANPQNYGRIARYTERLADAGHGEFAVLLSRDSRRRDPRIKQTQAYITLMTESEVGRLVGGE